MIHGALLAFNNLSLQNYLEVCFDNLVKNTPIPKQLIHIYLCCFHIFRLMATLIREHYDENSRKDMKELVEVSFNLDWCNFCKWFKNFYIITNTE